MAMGKSATDAYVYAKASGMLSKSFVGERANILFNIHSLQELWSLLFITPVPQIPEALLAQKLEEKAEKVFLSDFIHLVLQYSKPSPILTSLLHFYDYDNIKEFGAALCMGEKKCPRYADITPFNYINYSKWPELSLMTKDSPLSWYDKTPKLSEQQQNDARLDAQYIKEVWQNVKKVNSECREALVSLFQEEFRMENVLWALRLKLYYSMSNEEIKKHLVYESEKMPDNDVLACDAVKILDYELDSYDAWKNWKFNSLLNPHEEGSVWSVDPRWISAKYRKRFVDKAYKLFHTSPFTEAPLICWFLVKQRELDNIRTASEQLRLNINASEVHNG